jgi:uncharacterized protein YceH (UPF0502 family)
MNPTELNQISAHEASPPKRWTSLPAIERRVLGVLVEKAKTVPESYPMTLNGICTGCNQKNNRYPLMQLEPEQLDDPLERLRHLGAVALVQGSGRVEKYRHYASDWLGVDKSELAVMTELLLRGAQTEGELRQRASRMEPIADLPALRTILHNLERRGLVISLTSAGRGHVISHNLYEPRELEKVRREFESSMPAGVDDAADEPAGATNAPSSTATRPTSELRNEVDSLRAELREVKEQLAALRAEIAQQRAP